MFCRKSTKDNNLISVINKCIVCDSGIASPAVEFHEDLVRCDSCGFIYYRDNNKVDPVAIYNQDYFEGRYYNYLLDKKLFQKNFHKRLKVIQQFCPNGRLLEVGSAYGFFLELAKETHDVYGVDIAESGVNYARDTLNLPQVVCGDFLQENYPADFFDAVCLFDTIEHLQAPHLYLEKSARILKKGGMVFLTTGDIESRMARLQKKNWRLINIPTHLFYFSPATLRQMLGNYGLELVYISYPGNYRSLAAMIYLALIKDKNSFTESSFFKWLGNIAIYLNLYDIMFVGARKK